MVSSGGIRRVSSGVCVGGGGDVKKKSWEYIEIKTITKIKVAQKKVEIEQQV